MMPAEADHALREESAASSADSLERRFSEARPRLLDKYRALVRFYGTAEGPLIPRSLVFKLADPAMQNSAVWLVSEEILWLLEGRAPDPLAIPWLTA